MADDTDNSKKVDEEWKRRAREEKEKLAGEGAAEEGAAAKDKQQRPRSEPTFPFLVSSLVSQALIGIGQIPNPITNKAELNLEEAKFAIDMLQMLKEKTTGNLTDDEKRYIDSVLYDLRMRFLDAAGR